MGKDRRTAGDREELQEGRSPELAPSPRLCEEQSRRLDWAGGAWSKGLLNVILLWTGGHIFIPQVIRSSQIFFSRTWQEQRCAEKWYFSRMDQNLERLESCSTSRNLSKQHESGSMSHSPLCVQCLAHNSA